MQPRDKISKSSWTLSQGIKDVVTINVTSAVSSGLLQIEASQIEKLLSVIASSVDEGYHRGYNTFMKVSDVVLAEVVKDSASRAEASMPAFEKFSGTKKK
jgi:hypothetical protein